MDNLPSFYLIATAHRIGLSHDARRLTPDDERCAFMATLAKSTTLPWIADFRDPMLQKNYPPDPTNWRSFARLGCRTVAQALLLSVFTTLGTAGAYRKRYPRQAYRVCLLENGYDAETFSGVDSVAVSLNNSSITLLHSRGNSDRGGLLTEDAITGAYRCRLREQLAELLDWVLA